MPRPASARPAAIAAARARAALTVDVAHVGPGYVLDRVDRERVPGRDDQALRAVHEPDDRDLALSEDAIDVRQRVLAGLGVEQVRAREVAEPVA